MFLDIFLSALSNFWIKIHNTCVLVNQSSNERVNVHEFWLVEKFWANFCLTQLFKSKSILRSEWRSKLPTSYNQCADLLLKLFLWNCRLFLFRVVIKTTLLYLILYFSNQEKTEEFRQICSNRYLIYTFFWTNKTILVIG